VSWAGFAVLDAQLAFGELKLAQLESEYLVNAFVVLAPQVGIIHQPGSHLKLRVELCTGFVTHAGLSHRSLWVWVQVSIF
jgi:hypothetical protein